MIERNGQQKYRLEISPNDKRDKETLMTLLQKHVAKGSEAHSEKWKAYNEIESYGYTQKTVNHSENFVDPKTGAYTQNIEASLKRHVKDKLCRAGIRHEYIVDYLNEFLWHRNLTIN